MYILSKDILFGQIYQTKELDNFDYSACLAEGCAIMINKASGWTSFDVVSKIRNLIKSSAFGPQKVGHCGTLDPFATGLLILCFGKATKKIEQFQNMEKQYLATIRLGATTKSLDTEYQEENVIEDISYLSNEEVIRTILGFTGKIEQVPPMFSAKKIKGKKLYELARKGMDISVELVPSLVEIYNIDIISIELPYIKLKIDCSKGTYVRALARDIGDKLGVGGYLTSLERTKIGTFSIESAFSIKEFEDLLCNSSF